MWYYTRGGYWYTMYGKDLRQFWGFLLIWTVIVVIVVVVVVIDIAVWVGRRWCLRRRRCCFSFDVWGRFLSEGMFIRGGCILFACRSIGAWLFLISYRSVLIICWWQVWWCSGCLEGGCGQWRCHTRNGTRGMVIRVEFYRVVRRFCAFHIGFFVDILGITEFQR